MAKSNYKEDNKAFLQQKAKEEGVYKTAQGVKKGWVLYSNGLFCFIKWGRI